MAGTHRGKRRHAATTDKFYTDLWHVLLGRHKIDDVNGEYPDLTDGQRAGSFTRDIRVKTRTLPRDAAGRVVHHMYNSDAFWLTQWNSTSCGAGMARNADEMSASLIRYADNGGLIPGGPAPEDIPHHVRMSRPRRSSSRPITKG